MKICKVKLTQNTCLSCIDTQMTFGVIDDCSKCKLKSQQYELLSIGTSFWSGDWAMVQKDGKIEKVALDRVYDIEEVKQYDS